MTQMEPCLVCQKVCYQSKQFPFTGTKTQDGLGNVPWQVNNNITTFIQHATGANLFFLSFFFLTLCESK